MSIQKYIEKNRVSFEGSNAVAQLAELCKELGYKTSFGNALVDFLEDNPGAIENIYNFIDEHYKEKVNEIVEPEKVFEIPVSWTMTGTYYVRARSLLKAKEIVYNTEDFPTGTYVEESLIIDGSGCKELSEGDWHPDESKILKVE